MKRSLRLVSLILAVSLLLAMPVSAAENAESRASMFFSAHMTFLEQISPTGIRIWYDVDANAAVMDEIGVSVIDLYESTDGQSWTKVKTYEKEDYSSMIKYNSCFYTSYLSYSKAKTGYYYCADVTFYARNSIGFGELCDYTAIMQMS